MKSNFESLEGPADEPAPSLTDNALVAVPASRETTDFREGLAAATAPPQGRAPRDDGWTPERIRIFLITLSECGVVSDAARAAGISVPSAYRFRNRAGGRAFHIAWNAAQALARRRLADTVLSRAMHGWTETIRRGGEIWGERNRLDNRLSMAVLTRLDDQARRSDEENALTRVVVEEFDEFVDIVSAGGGGAAQFIEARQASNFSLRNADEPDLLYRLDRYGQCGTGAPEVMEDDDEADDDDGCDGFGDGSPDIANARVSRVVFAQPEVTAPEPVEVAPIRACQESEPNVPLESEPDPREQAAREIDETIDVSDLHVDSIPGWKEADADRAVRSGLVARLEPWQQEQFRARFGDWERK